MTGKPYVPTCMNRGGEIDPIALGCLVPGCTSEVGVACRMPTALGADAATPSPINRRGWVMNNARLVADLQAFTIAAHLADALHATAVGANSAVGPDTGLNVGVGCFFVVKVGR